MEKTNMIDGQTAIKATRFRDGTPVDPVKARKEEWIAYASISAIIAGLIMALMVLEKVW